MSWLWELWWGKPSVSAPKRSEVKSGIAPIPRKPVKSTPKPSKPLKTPKPSKPLKTTKPVKAPVKAAKAPTKRPK